MIETVRKQSVQLSLFLCCSTASQIRHTSPPLRYSYNSLYMMISENIHSSSSSLELFWLSILSLVWGLTYSCPSIKVQGRAQHPWDFWG